MAGPRIHVPPERIAGDRAELDGAAAHHLSVLRLAPGDRVEVFDGRGRAWEAEVEALAPAGGALRLRAAREAPPALRPFVLLQGLAKGEKMELVIQKAVELGVTGIHPVACERSVVRLDAAKGAKRAERWRKIAAEAARQCGRADLPEVREPRPLAEALAELRGRDDLAKLVAWEEAEAVGLKAFLEAHAHLPGHALVVGPEGGLSEAEVRAARAAGFEAVTLGRRILRTETAALAVLAAVRFFQGELG